MSGACYKEEAIECVKDCVLPLHKEIYAKYNGEFIYEHESPIPGRIARLHL